MSKRKIFAVDEGGGGSPSPSPTLEPNKAVLIDWYDYTDPEVVTEVTPSTGYDGMEKVTVTSKLPNLQATKTQTIDWEQSGTVLVTPSTGYDAMEKARITVTQPTVITPQVTYTTNGDNYVFPEDFNVDFLSGVVVKVNVPSQPSQQVHPLIIYANQSDVEFRLTFTDSTPSQTIAQSSADQTKNYYGILDNIQSITGYTPGTYQRTFRANYITYDDLTPTSLRLSPAGAQVRTVIAQGTSQTFNIPLSITISNHEYKLLCLGGGSA